MRTPYHRAIARTRKSVSSGTMSGTKKLGSVPPDGHSPTVLAKTEVIGDPGEALRLRAAALGFAPAILKADDEARTRSAVKATLRSQYAPTDRVPPLPIEEVTRSRMLELLLTFPMTLERIELEVIIRGGKLAPLSERVISPAAYTVETK